MHRYEKKQLSDCLEMRIFAYFFPHCGWALAKAQDWQVV
jgi:hypothetical protein